MSFFDQGIKNLISSLFYPSIHGSNSFAFSSLPLSFYIDIPPRPQQPTSDNNNNNNNNVSSSGDDSSSTQKQAVLKHVQEMFDKRPIWTVPALKVE